jgi:uncharacterized protein YecE (DUF72 family)
MVTSFTSEEPMHFKMGCAIWAYKGWLGDLYPAKSAPSRFLALYGERFTTVEVNSTFYAIPTPATVAKWAEQTPVGFEFCPKMHRSITHDGLLKPNIAAALQFVELMQGLKDKLGPIFIQLPPSYGPSAFADLTAFLEALSSSGAELALEVRHPQWFVPQPAAGLEKLLTRLGIGTVCLDTRPIYDCDDDPQVTSQRRKPKLPVQPRLTAEFGFVRFISHPQQGWNSAFIQSWLPHLQTWLQQGKRLYLFIHCPVEEHSPQNARQFQRALELANIPVPPLPWEQLAQPPQQLGLF